MNTTSPFPITESNSTGNITREYVRPFSDQDIIASASLLLPLMVLGILGNTITLLVIALSDKLKSVFNLFILSLCVSDLTSSIISPLFLYRRTWGYDDWQLPSFLCKVYWAADMWTSYVTALHILLFAILRLISIRFPQSYTRMKQKHARICIVLIWIIAFLAGFIPFAWWYDAGVRRRNMSDIDSRWPACTLEPEWADAYGLYQKIAFPFFFYVPTVLIISLTITIGVLLSVRRRQRNEKLQKQMPTNAEKKLQKSARKEKEAMVQLGMIAGSFMLGYIPFTAYEISSMVIPSKTAADERFWWKFGMAEYICLRFSETLNPVFYNLASPKMRQETIKFLRRMTSCCGAAIGRSRHSTPSTSVSDSQGLPPLKSIAYAEQHTTSDKL